MSSRSERLERFLARLTNEKQRAELREKLAGAPEGAFYVQTWKVDGSEDVEAVVLRKPTMPEHDEFVSHSMDDAKKPTAIREFIEQILVYPPRQDWEGILARQPAIPSSIINKAMPWIGMGVETEGEAL